MSQIYATCKISGNNINEVLADIVDVLRSRLNNFLYFYWMKLSVVIITFNEEKNIGRCIDSVSSIADEILILDSSSTDQTAAIAEKKGAIVKQEVFKGFIQKKNKAVELATYDYVLSLDADEALDPTLAASIKRVKENFTGKAYSMNRCTNYCGKFIRYGSWYPDTKIRLFDRTMCHWGGTNPHDKIILNGKIATEHLKGDILHYSYSTISEHTIQNDKLSSISADSLFKEGKRTSLISIAIHPVWAFIKCYFIKLGLLEGFYGFIIAINVAHLAFLKHAKLYQKQKASSSISPLS